MLPRESPPVNKEDKMVRYAVVGLGHIAQAAVLPAFANAKENSRLTALVSDDPEKLRELGATYHIDLRYSYDQFEKCLNSGEIDAVYIALPNHLHAPFTEMAAKAGIHVLCEKPMANTEEECSRMLQAASSNDVRLMVAYRLHFDPANLGAIQAIQSGRIGSPRFFHSILSRQIKPGNVRLRAGEGGGPLYDLGVYCINAARYLFRAEPLEVTAFHATPGDARFENVEEMTTALLRFPEERLAALTCSFGAAEISSYQVIGTAGDLRMDPAYGYTDKLTQYITRDGRTEKKVYQRGDQFAAELLYFSRCLLNAEPPEPSGLEGLADVRVIQALYRSAASGRAVPLAPFEKPLRPSGDQQIHRPPVVEPDLVNAESGSE